MIITQETSKPVFTSAGLTPSKFKIKASAKAFKILSGFYSEPILAIPRELGANAWDSHVDAENTDRMFEVHAPNTLEPWFSIRDFGTGLSPKAIEQIYTTYFESTKTDDNDSDGCMGLGSKTPFNYTENFSVISYYNGIKYVYNCFIDETGSPNILQFATEMTKEHNGVEVKFAVKSGDIAMFVDKIRQAYAPFRFRPIITGASIVYEKVEYHFEGKNWALRKSSQRHSNQSYAYMGNYSYPINVSALFTGDKYGNPDYQKINTCLGDGSFELYFNIGDLEVAPNKEQLQYDADQKTQKAVIAAALVAYDELKELALKSVEKPKSVWNGMELYKRYNSYNSPLHFITNIIGGVGIKFGNKDVTYYSCNVSEVHRSSGIADSLPTGKRFEEHYGFFKVEQYDFNRVTAKFRKVGSGHYIAEQSDDVYGTVFLYTFGDNIKRARIRNWIKTNYPGGDHPQIYIISDQSVGGQVFKAHAKFFGWDASQMVEIESLPKPPRAPRSPTTSKTDGIHFYNMDFEYWDHRALTVSSTKSYYYVDFYYSDVTYKTKELSKRQITCLFKYAVEHKLIDAKAEIYGINRKNVFMLKTGTWVNVIDLVKKNIDKKTAHFAHQLYIKNTYLPECRKYSDLASRCSRQDIISNIDNKDTVEKFRRLEKSQNFEQVVGKDDIIAQVFGIKAEKSATFVDDIGDVAKDITTKYMGIFDIVNNYHSSAASVASIINFIDKNS